MGAFSDHSRPRNISNGRGRAYGRFQAINCNRNYLQVKLQMVIFEPQRLVANILRIEYRNIVSAFFVKNINIEQFVTHIWRQKIYDKINQN